ncbi:LAFA_0A06106g1_1 [Lachancea sp. 'fantastica']|nr:LAFA_0A06106g1_1 [Lachancea sp. 'fantastica']
MNSFLEYAQCFVALAFTYTARVLTWLVPLLLRFAQTHPTTTNVFGYLLAAYISWKIICHLWTVLKRIMLALLVVFAALLWSRGLHQVVSHDVPVLMQYLEPHASFQELWNRFCYYAHPTRFTQYYSTALQLQLETLRDHSLQFLANLSN